MSDHYTRYMSGPPVKSMGRAMNHPRRALIPRGASK